MAKDVKEVTVQLRFRKRPHGAHVHFKSDGNRFESQRTIKFNVDSKYTTDITIAPVLSMELCQFYGTDQKLLLKQLEDDYVMYKTEWNTSDIPKTKDGTRIKVPIALRLKNFGEIQLSIQCKFYPEKEIQHACWGPVCGQVEFRCTQTDNSPHINVSENVLI